MVPVGIPQRVRCAMCVMASSYSVIAPHPYPILLDTRSLTIVEAGQQQRRSKHQTQGRHGGSILCGAEHWRGVSYSTLLRRTNSKAGYREEEERPSLSLAGIVIISRLGYCTVAYGRASLTMDDLSESLGQLSTKAKEWKPSFSLGSSSSIDSGAPPPLSPRSNSNSMRAAAVAGQSPPASPSHGWKPSMPGRSTSSSSSDWRAADEDTTASAMSGATWSNARAPEFVPRGGAPNSNSRPTGALPRSSSSSSWSAASGAQQHLLNHTATSNSSLSIAHGASFS
eukprot:scaffold178854_cov58-Attheya_sp.AAC.2